TRCSTTPSSHAHANSFGRSPNCTARKKRKLTDANLVQLLPTLRSKLPARCRGDAGVNGCRISNRLRVGFALGAGALLWTQMVERAGWSVYCDLQRNAFAGTTVHHLLRSARNWYRLFTKHGGIPGVGAQQ